ncbi:MAG: sigma-70 family RNA polymerase sigma factor [Clostridium sp.]|nr:sigma-70 family RNA polymerase sigma factor [Clostridium sp.]
MSDKEQRLHDILMKSIMENKIAMFRLAYSFVLNREDAEDIVSETILKAYSHLAELRNVKKIKSWMFQILVNESRAYLKKRNRIELTEDTSRFAGQEDEREDDYDLLDFVYQLDDIYRDVTILYYFEEFRVKEIAKILDISSGTVKSRLSRARERLKKFITEDDEYKRRE